MQVEKKPFSCPMCGSQFYFSTRMKDHIEKNHKSQDLTVSEVLKEHTSRVQEGTTPFLCDSCEALKLNIKGMQAEKKPFSCPMCCSQFYFSTRMKDHIEKESKIARPYCVRGLKEHTSRVHEGTKPFLCDSCEESFAKDFKLKLHIKGMQMEKKPFSCPMCGSQFYFSTRMKDHIEKNHKSQQDLTVSEVRKNTLVEFMKE